MKINAFNELYFLISLRSAINTKSLNVNWLLKVLNIDRKKAIVYIKKYQNLIIDSLPSSEIKSLINLCINEIGIILPSIFRKYNFEISLIKKLLEMKSNLEIINLISKNNFEILSAADTTFFEVCNKYKHKTSEIDSFLKEWIIIYQHQYLRDYASKLIKLNQNKDQLIISLLSQIFDEVFRHENLSWLDVNYLTMNATYNNVIQIGNKIIKIGSRVCYDIPSDERILTPIIRINLSEIDSELKGVIELTERVEVMSQLSKEDGYQIYKELRERDIVYTDIKASNIGILLKDNIQHWSKPISNNLEILRYKKNSDKKVLTAGNWIILDADHIYWASDPNIHWCHGSKEYEQRYQKEKTGTEKTLASKFNF